MNAPNSEPSTKELLARCREEPVHIPGQIQPFGALLAYDTNSGQVAYASENVAAYLDAPPGDLLGRPVEQVLGADVRSTVEEVDEFSSTRNYTHLTIRLGEDQPVHLTMHQHAKLAIVEMEDASESEIQLPEHLPSYQEEVLASNDPQMLHDCATAHIRALTGFEHVMVYQFHRNWDGEVIAEDRTDNRPAFKGHRFPSTDIPEQVRDLYRMNRLRVIPDATADPVPIVGEPDDPIDLSYSILRSVSPVHLRYLSNMDVEASMSISIIVEDRLWGLIACHHSFPRPLGPAVRRVCRLYGRSYAMQLTHLLREERLGYIERHRETIRIPHRASRTDQALIDHLANHGGELLNLLNASGLILHLYGETQTAGEVPERPEQERLLEWLDENHSESVWMTDHLAANFPDGWDIKDVASGLLLMHLSDDPSNRIVWLRPEVVQTIEWGGNPDHKVEADDEGEMLSPRSSFETWRQEVEGRSKPWTAPERAVAHEFRSHLLEALISEDARREKDKMELIHSLLRHDIRHDAGVIQGFGDLLANKAGEELQEYISPIVTASHRIGDLATKVSAAVRVIGSQGDIELEDIDLCEIVRAEVERARGTYPDAQVHWPEDGCGQGQTLMVRASGLLSSAIRNLISNAITHNDKAIPQVDVQIAVGDKQVTVSVADNGPGIPRERRDVVLREGVKGVDSEGSGLGLFLVHVLAEQYGGDLTIHGNDPEGTIVEFTVPLAGVDT